MTPLLDNLTPSDDDTELVGSRVGRIDPDNFRTEDGVLETENEESLESEDNGLSDEPVDKDGGTT